MAKSKEVKKGNTGAKVAGIIGITAATALAAYLVYDKKGTKEKYKKAKHWVVDAKNDLMLKVKKIKELDRQVYNDAVEQIMNKYRQVSSIATPEIKGVVRDLKAYWTTIKDHVSKQQKTTRTKSAGTKKAAARKAPAKTPAKS